jgi:hypothetical protein
MEECRGARRGECGFGFTVRKWGEFLRKRNWFPPEERRRLWRTQELG